MAKKLDPEQPMFLRVPLKCRLTVIKALQKAGFETEARRVLEFTRDYALTKANRNRLKWLERADEQVAKDGHIEFDSDATISHSEGGQYVLGWVWVDGPEEEES